MKPSTWPLAIILLGALLHGCGDSSAVKDAAQKAMVSFHKRYNMQAYAAIYKGSHDNFKDSGTLHNFRVLMQTVHAKLGKVESSRNNNWSVKKIDGASVITLNQETDFKNGTGVEIFRYIVQDQKAMLAGYKINSSELK